MKKIEVGFLISKQHKELLVFVVLTCIIVIADFSFVLKKQWSLLIALGSKIGQARQSIKESSADALRVDSLRNRLEEISKAVTKNKQGIIEEGQIPAIMSEISKLADTVNLKIMQIRPQPEVHNRDKTIVAGATEYYSLPIVLLTRGDYHPFGKFIYELEKAHFFVRVDNIDILPQPAAVSLAHDIRLSVSVFVANTEQKASK
jgi:Tfp pilus assembly protein PilO